jgi:hypothetical protein
MKKCLLLLPVIAIILSGCYIASQVEIESHILKHFGGNCEVRRIPNIDEIMYVVRDTNNAVWVVRACSTGLIGADSVRITYKEKLIN